MPITQPAPLKEGDLMALLGPASPMDSPEDVEKCINSVKAMGFRVRAYPSARKRFDYLAGTDAQRAKDLNVAFADPKVKAIICIRGGYGSSRLLDMLDWPAIKKNPKWLIGFSDITSVIGGLHTQCNMASLHGPMPTVLIKDEATAKIMTEASRRVLLEGFRGLSFREFCGDHFKPQIITKGTAKGTLIGGNLSLFAGLIGTPYLPKPRKAILFLEEVGEKPYKLDRYITQMRLGGFFKNVAGIVLGQFTDCNPGKGDIDDAMTVLKRLLKPYGVPILAGLPVGHERPTFPLPLGVEATLDAVKGDLILR